MYKVYMPKLPCLLERALPLYKPCIYEQKKSVLSPATILVCIVAFFLYC